MRMGAEQGRPFLGEFNKWGRGRASPLNLIPPALWSSPRPPEIQRLFPYKYSSIFWNILKIRYIFPESLPKYSRISNLVAFSLELQCYCWRKSRRSIFKKFQKIEKSCTELPSEFWIFGGLVSNSKGQKIIKKIHPIEFRTALKKRPL